MKGQAATDARHLDWEGLRNVRDLGGLRTRDGRVTCWGRVVRSEAPELLTERGVRALREYGIRTILDLRDPLERPPQPPRIAGISALHVSVLDLADRAFFAALPAGTSIHSRYRELLERWPSRFAQAFSTLAGAQRGGVLIHCQAGRDRTGLIAALLLSLAGVEAQLIAQDYALSAARLAPHFEGAGTPPPAGIAPRAWLRGSNVSPSRAILDLLDGFDVRGYLLAAGCSEAVLDAAVGRLLVA